MNIQPNGFRKDVKPFFTQYVLSIPTSQKQNSPFLVVFNGVIRKVTTVNDLLTYPSNAEVLQCWPGKTRSDVFYFVIKQLKDHMKGE